MKLFFQDLFCSLTHKRCVLLLLIGWSVFCFSKTTIGRDASPFLQWSGNWVADGPVGGNIAKLIIHPLYPNILFAGTDDGVLYRSDDRGNTWNQIKPGLERPGVRISCLAFYPASPDIIYAGTAKIWNTGGLYRSLDRGETWNKITAGIGEISVHALQFDPKNPAVLYAGTENGIYKSINGGSNWVRTSEGL
jgi:hypothetical protein